jgi:hypothetical protein
MADLPSNAPSMFQLPGPAVPYQGNMGTGAAAGAATGMQAFQQQQAIQQKQQEMQIEKNMKMLETGSQMMLEGGPQVQSTGQSLIQKAYPFLTGQPLPQGMPLGKEQAKDLGWYMDQHRLFQTSGGAEGLSAQDAVTGATQAMSNYGSKYQQQQMGLLEKTPMYKEGMANEVGGQVNGQPATKNEFTGAVSSTGGQSMPGAQGSFIDAGQAATLQNSLQNNAASEFQDSSKDQKEILDNGSSFLNMLAPRIPENMTKEQKDEFALHDKQAVLKYIQMQVPSSKRPPNMTMEDLAKSGLISEQAKVAYDKAVVGGSPLSNDLRDALLQTGAQTVLTHEGILSRNEGSVANRAIRNRVDPMKAITNLRPAGVPSSSPFFKNQDVPGRLAQTGQIIKGSDGHYVFRGQSGTNDYKDKNNWMKID